MLLNVISLNLYNDPKSWNDHFPLHILSLTFSVLSVPRRWTFCGLYHRLPCPCFFESLGLATGRPQKNRSGQEEKTKKHFPLAPSMLDQGLIPSVFLLKGPSSYFIPLPFNYSCSALLS